jgi:cell wall-associated NlpC family hydrolase
MMGLQLARAAEALVGTPFRLHGRDPATGLDCIGLFAAAMAAIGRDVAVPTGYPLRVRRLEGWLPDPVGFGLCPAQGGLEAGDVLLIAPGPCQLHLAIASAAGGWIHAHAGLRRVVHDAACPAGGMLHHWRLVEPF